MNKNHWRNHSTRIVSQYDEKDLDQVIFDSISYGVKQTKIILLRKHIAQKLEKVIFTNNIRTALYSGFYRFNIILEKFIESFSDSDNWEDVCIPNYKIMFQSNTIKKCLSKKKLEEICMSINFNSLVDNEDVEILAGLENLKQILESAKQISNVAGVINDRATGVLSEINKELVKVREN